MKKYCIYLHKNKLNNKVYIGQTCQKPEARWNNGEGYKNSPLFYNAIKKYGWNNFEHSILATDLSADDANKLEQYYIKQYHSTDQEYGYNIQVGGHNAEHSDGTKQKMSLNQKGAQNSFYGHRHTEATKKRIGLSQKGNKHHAAKRVECIETHQIFDTLTDAAIWCNGNANFRGKISEVCRGKRQSAGKHPITREKLHWRYAT